MALEGGVLAHIAQSAAKCDPGLRCIFPVAAAFISAACVQAGLPAPAGECGARITPKLPVGEFTRRLGQQP